MTIALKEIIRYLLNLAFSYWTLIKINYFKYLYNFHFENSQIPF